MKLENKLNERIKVYHHERVRLNGVRQIDYAESGKQEIKLDFDLSERQFQKYLLKYVKSLSERYK